MEKVLDIEGEMPEDLYNVYKNVTRYSYVTEANLFNLYKNMIICKKPSGLLKKRAVKRLEYMRDNKAIAFCERDEVVELRKRNYIQGRPKSLEGHKGIPQGLPISAVLANVYMSEFDEMVVNHINETDTSVIYKRYSDDIIVVCPIPEAGEWREFIMSRIRDVKLEIQPHKTSLFEIHVINHDIRCFHELFGSNNRIEYLGFSFDGKKILLKDSSLCKYYHKMHRAVKRVKVQAIRYPVSGKAVFHENKLLKRYSLAGAQIRSNWYVARTIIQSL